MDTTGVIQLIVLLLLILLSAFFSSAETALVSVNKVRIRTLAEDGNKAALRVQRIHNNYSKMLSTILVGNNIVNISASALATSATIRMFGSAFVGAATGLLTLLVLLFGEIVPKTWATSHSFEVSLAYSSIIRLLMILLTPIVFIVDHVSSGIIRLFRLDKGTPSENLTEDELRTYVDVGKEEGVIEHEEHEMINNVFDFSDSTAEEIMIPRIDMSSVPLSASYWQVRRVFQGTMYSRLPVYDTDPDQVVGIVLMKDFFFVGDARSFNIKQIMRPAYYTHEKKKTSDLLIEMRDKSLSVAFVLDEYGATVGMITMEDLLEEIVGEIRDEYDEDEEEQIKAVEDNNYLIEGNMKIDDINEALNLNISSEDYDSIAGLFMEYLDRLPEENELITLPDGIMLQAKRIDQNRVDKVLLMLPGASTSQDPAGSEMPEDTAPPQS